MTVHRAPLLACAALALGLAPTARGDAPAELACRTGRASVSGFAAPGCCPDPCERVGPVRRLLRRIFRPCCTPPPPRVVAPAVAFPAPVVAAPPLTAPPAPADLGRPFVPPGAGSSARRDAPAPPPPVRVDRIASARGVQATLVSRSSRPVPNAKVALIHAERANVRRQLEADADGRINAELEAGTWLVYSRDANGRYVYRGKLEVTGKDAVRARLLVE